MGLKPPPGTRVDPSAGPAPVRVSVTADPPSLLARPVERTDRALPTRVEVGVRRGLGDAARRGPRGVLRRRGREPGLPARRGGLARPGDARRRRARTARRRVVSGLLKRKESTISEQPQELEGVRVAHLDELERIDVAGVVWRPVRRPLDVTGVRHQRLHRRRHRRPPDRGARRDRRRLGQARGAVPRAHRARDLRAERPSSRTRLPARSCSSRTRRCAAARSPPGRTRPCWSSAAAPAPRYRCRPGSTTSQPPRRGRRATRRGPPRSWPRACASTRITRGCTTSWPATSRWPATARARFRHIEQGGRRPARPPVDHRGQRLRLDPRRSALSKWGIRPG